MKVAVIGANGQLGSDICREFQDTGYEVFPLTHNMFEICDLNVVNTTMHDLMPDIVVNTAAMHNLDACEQDPGKAFEINGIGARNLSYVSNTVGFKLMHISTDYVFDGVKEAPYVETDCPTPLNVYGNTKLAGEFFIRTTAERFFILRVSGLYGKNKCRAKGGLNFVTLMLKLAKERDEVRVVDDELLTPTYTGNIAKQSVQIAEKAVNGIYHVTAQSSCSWYQFAAKIFEITGTKVRLSVADPNEFPMKVPRPKYSVLDNRSLKDLDLDIMPHWEVGLRQFLESLEQ